MLVSASALLELITKQSLTWLEVPGHIPPTFVNATLDLLLSTKVLPPRTGTATEGVSSGLMDSSVDVRPPSFPLVDV